MGVCSQLESSIASSACKELLCTSSGILINAPMISTLFLCCFVTEVGLKVQVNKTSSTALVLEIFRVFTQLRLQLNCLVCSTAEIPSVILVNLATDDSHPLMKILLAHISLV